MGCYAGIDIGAISAKASLILDKADLDACGAPQGWELFNADANGDARIYLSPYRRTRGKPLAAATELLDEIISAVGADRVAGVTFTGSAAKLAAEKLSAAEVNEFRAIAAGLTAMGIEARTVFEMGGETSKYMRLSAGDEGYGIVDYSTNGDCAAGTGSFIDQQAGRLKYNVEELGEICLSAERAAAVAGRCSVFAKSDMIHAQQKGYTPAEVLRGLCLAVARNFRTAVVRSHPVEPPVAFLGGLAANSAVVRALREASGLDEKQLFVPRGFAHVPAVGAAALAAKAGASAGLAHMKKLRAASDSAHGAFPTTNPLTMDRVVLLRDRVEPYEAPYGDGPIDAYLGIDIGSVSTNLVLIDEEGRMMHEIYVRTQGRPIEVVGEGLREIRRAWGRRARIRGVGTTGSGRELIGQLVGADTVNDEITAHKTGATFLGRTMLDGRVPDTIFEIGGQDSKYISLQDGVVVDFTMNEACAAGTGSFLEERAEELEIAIKGQFAELALSSRAPVRLGERCTVFMERDVNSYLQRGAEKADLVAGLAYSVVYNYINRVVRGRPIGRTVFFQGGTAYNDAVAAAFAAVTGQAARRDVPPG
ncbi:MAG TPA: acyl-CoA dehydratase activase, partial [Phycisphaerae bacterium]|nr:acyl-CoA dehydratase activase [Phycisphaerae bacterium]